MSLKRCKCGYPLDMDNHCNSCRIRKKHKLPKDARCETCKFNDTLRCVIMGPHSVCSVWARKGDPR